MGRRGNRGQPMRPMGMYDGVLLVDKPAGPTSHDVVAKIRSHYRFGKVGHGGTLDPQATGLLVILVERGTKLSNTFLTSDKAYEGTMRLGVSTDSQDSQGKVISEADASHITEEMLLEEMAKFKGDTMQTPPMVSAVKKNGVALYKLARKGKTVKRDPKMIHVYSFGLVSFDPPQASFALECTKGTYVRTICSDIGDNLGCGASLDSLRRTRSGDLHVKDALTLDDLLELDETKLLDRIIPVHKFAARRIGPVEQNNKG